MIASWSPRSASRRSSPASCSSSARAATLRPRRHRPRLIGPKGLPFAPFLASLFLFILANNMSIVPLAQISPMSQFAFPLVLAVITYVLYNWVGIREQGVGRYFKDAASRRACRRRR